MATNSLTRRTTGTRTSSAGITNRSSGVMWSILISLAVLVAVVLIIRNWPGPVLPDDPDVLKSVDALFTAVTSANASRLAHCTKRLEELHAQSRVSPKTWECLDSVMHQASEGNWQGASRRLYKLMSRPTSQTALGRAEMLPVEAHRE